MRQWRKVLCLMLTLFLLTSAAACAGGGDGSGLSSEASGGPSSDTSEPFDDGPSGADPSEVNPVIKLSEKPQKPWLDPASYSVYGAAAPEWMRDAEMYTEAKMHDMFLTRSDFQTWGPYFDLCIGAWSGDVMKLREQGIKAGSYFDPYHVYSREDLAIVGPDGKGLQSDYASDTGSPLYLMCHNSDAVLQYGREYVENCLSFGAQGMFYDDIRMPYHPLRENAQKCYSTLHTHESSEPISTSYLNRTVSGLYRLVKERNPNFYVVLNGGNPMGGSDEDAIFEQENLWKYADACMWEHFFYDANTTRWLNRGTLLKAAKRISAGIREGKTQLILSYSYDKMTAAKAIRAATETLAYCRMYDMMWSDYASLYASPVSQEVTQRIYGIKTGPAGRLGVYYGTVVEEESGAPISGVTVEAGGVTAVTDANGCFRIEMPVNCYTVSLSKAGYTAAQATVRGYQFRLTMKKEVGTVYYVSPFGSNDNDGLSAEKAFRSLNYAEVTGKLQPGDTVAVTEGIYNLPEETLYTGCGTAEHPITYAAQGNAVLRIKGGTGKGLVLNGDYTVFTGFTVEGSESGAAGLVTVGGNYVEVKNCVFRDLAYYTKRGADAAAAITLDGTGARFHHNIVGQDLYAEAAVAVNGTQAEVVHNTFDGGYCVEGRTAAALAFGDGVSDVTVQNNIFTRYDRAYTGYEAGRGRFGGNLFSAIGDNAEGCMAEGDRRADNLRFMYAPLGDYGLKQDSVAVNSGVEAGFAWRGESPDVGAKESKFSSEGYEAAMDDNGCLYRVFADTVVVMNLSQTDYTVSVPTGRAGVQLKDAVTDNVTAADGEGVLHIFAEAGTSVILQAR